MKRLLFLLVVVLGSAAIAAADVELGCKRVRLVLDARLTAAVVAREWGRGRSRPERRAAMELRGCQGQLLHRLVLEGALARLDPTPIRGTSAPTYLVSVDLTADAGSYNGPLTMPVEVVGDRLVPAVAQAADGRIEPIRMAETGKAAWKKVPSGEVDDLLSVRSQPQGQGFVILYRRYHPSSQGWLATMRSDAGLWESDQDFPETGRFPR